MRRIYFDNAATTPMLPGVIETIGEQMHKIYGNPSSIHHFGRVAKNEVESARKSVANILGASIGEVFFTSGGTEANNMALKCAVRDLGIRRVISSPIEHHCVLHSLQRLEKESSLDLQHVKLDENGAPDLNDLEHLLTTSSSRTLVSLMHANNETGVMIDLERFGTLCRDNQAYFHSDTVQTIGHHHFDLAQTSVDFITGSSHKFHGPKGVGFIYIKAGIGLSPFLDGGAQERNMRAGTENISGIVGTAKALSLIHDQWDKRAQRIKNIRAYIQERIKDTLPGTTFNDAVGTSQLESILSVNFAPSAAADLLTFNLDIEGISASGGSACASGTENASHVMSAIKPDFVGTTIRFSFSGLNTIEEADFLIQKLSKILGTSK